jgi:hypothetical protein
MARPCCSNVFLDLHRPNPSFIDTSRVVLPSTDTGPPPDAVLIDCDRDFSDRKFRHKKPRRRRAPRLDVA